MRIQSDASTRTARKRPGHGRARPNLAVVAVLFIVGIGAIARASDHLFSLAQNVRLVDVVQLSGGGAACGAGIFALVFLLRTRSRRETSGLYVLVERYRNGDPVPVYRRLRDRGRALPEGLSYISSWVSTDLGRCYQVMASKTPELLEGWLAEWQDLVDFEVVPVMTSQSAQDAVSPRL